MYIFRKTVKKYVDEYQFESKENKKDIDVLKSPQYDVSNLLKRRLIQEAEQLKMLIYLRTRRNWRAVNINSR